MAIAVMGMHRSGTSMVTQMLATCGMQVGPAHELMGATPENPTGYWERRPMVVLDDVILDRLGLAWDHLPALPRPGWELDPALDDVLVEARRIAASFSEDTPWGWKDPRASIVLALWERALGQAAATVLCVRNPLDVASSLARRGGMSPRHAFSLWHAYSDAALELARARRHVVTHYDAYFHDAGAELERACVAIGLNPTHEQLATAAGVADRAHRHSAHGLADLVRSGAPDETVALYLELLAASGPVMAEVARTDPMVVEQDDDPADREEMTAWVAAFRREQGIASIAAS